MEAVNDGVLPWIMVAGSRFSFEIGAIILLLTLMLCVFALFLLIRRIAGIVAEKTEIRRAAAALAAGELLPSERKRRIGLVKKRVGGLRLKLVTATMVLVLLVNVLASIPVFIFMLQTQTQTLVRGLWDRSSVMLEGLVSSVGIHLYHGNIDNTSRLLSQVVAIPEAMFITITGYNPETLVFDDQVWASNDPNILGKIDTPVLVRGYSRMNDALSPYFRAMREELNSLARERVGGYPENIIAISQQIMELTELLRYSDSPEIVEHLKERQSTLYIHERRVSETLARVTTGIRSIPEYTLDNMRENPRFLFYKPVMLRLGAEDAFFWGLVRLEVSVRSILDEIEAEQNFLLWINLLIALAAQLIGAIGSLLLSNYILKPIGKLVTHVETIRDTHDKTKLIGQDIELNAKDELAILGSSINDMTRSLVKAALAASELSIAKEFQKKFIPLALDAQGGKLTSGFEETAYLNIFSYYEGAKDVSGDYFDYQDLDGRYYAIIKCDVAGKGVPASFIMIQVATMFLNYCKQWQPTEKGMHIEVLVYQINEFIENLSFEDRFVAFTFCLYDSLTGAARFCNAGDNIIHLYDASQKKFKSLFLPETPAAGVLPNVMVVSKGGYRVQTITLDHGDMLLLFTDGIDESKRKFRNAEFEEIICADGSNGTPHENHIVGQWVEEFGHDRVRGIVNAVMNKQIYTLHKWHNGEGDDKDLQFDFRTSRGTVEEVIMALISVEKMFRCYYDPIATKEDKVLVDKIVDAFLKKHFLQYRNYCSFTSENPAKPAYMYYTHVMEDEQYDDLTILGLKRK